MKLGPCCICATAEAEHPMMLRRRSPVPGHGWGCVVCDLPADGATAVLCTPCADKFERGEAELKFACRGYPATEGRVPLAELPEGEFGHDMAKHKAEEERLRW